MLPYFYNFHFCRALFAEADRESEVSELSMWTTLAEFLETFLLQEMNKLWETADTRVNPKIKVCVT